MINEFRVAALNEMLGFFRKKDQTPEQGNAEAIRMMMLIAMIYQQSGAGSALKAMALCNMPARYQTTLMEVLEKDCP